MSDNYEGPDDEPEMDIADQVAYADTGRPWAAKAIKHPSHMATRKHFKSQPLPGQRGAGAA